MLTQMLLRVIFSHKFLISEQSIIKQGQHLSFLSTFSPKSCDLFGLRMQGQEGEKSLEAREGLGDIIYPNPCCVTIIAGMSIVLSCLLFQTRA